MLTKKEIEVLRLKKKNLTQVEIASILKITQPAVSGFYNNAVGKIREAKRVVKMAKDMKIKVEENEGF